MPSNFSISSGGDIFKKISEIEAIIKNKNDVSKTSSKKSVLPVVSISLYDDNSC
jgi:hypothetical protein